jgi:uncharacterized protein
MSERILMPVQMELRRIIVSEVDSNRMIVLKEVEGERQLTIMIGLFEATSINRRVHNVENPRPLSHDLIITCIEQLGGEIQDIVINDLVDGTYFAQIRVRRDGELLEIDSRPSDAIPIAVTQKCPIWVNEDVFGELDDENPFEASDEDDEFV